MGNIYEYFAATGDEVAVTALETGSGRDLDSAFDVVFTKGIDPAVQIGTLEELLVGWSFEEILQDPRSAHSLGLKGGEGEHGVVTLNDHIVQALAKADRAKLAEVAVPWSRTEEFWGQGDPENLTEFLVELAALAQRAIDRGHRLYCRWSL
ncbi:hypothetical protein [Actinocorallia populi]|uniref:hypothetical protein n=1 Tax=Actinocorallia populi TaxID=2079200 RepID=UPI000D08EDE9|nr:hypothetical protein [Actinocorallia populi]